MHRLRLGFSVGDLLDARLGSLAACAEVVLGVVYWVSVQCSLLLKPPSGVRGGTKAEAKRKHFWQTET